MSEAISLLQKLGLQEYEARCFMALTQLSRGTAKEIHEVSGVPRTRVYDAVRVLEAEGLTEVQHSNPQVFRAVDIEEAVQILKRKYDSRIETLRTHLEETELRETEEPTDQLQEVWSLTGHDAIEARTLELIDGAESEVGLVIIDEDILSEELFESLHDAVNRDVTVLLGGQTDIITSQLDAELPSVQVFETGLDWLVGAEDGQQVAISRLLLVDRETLLIGSFYPNSDREEPTEQAVFASGLENGLVVLLRRLLSSGLTPVEDPGR